MNHTLNHYLIGGLALLIASGGLGLTMHRIDTIPAPHVSHFAWPGLTAPQEAALQKSLEDIGKDDVTIWCAGSNCADLAEDLQFVAYQAGWDTHSDVPVYGAGNGLSVAPDDDRGRNIAKAITAATGIPVAMMTDAGVTGYSIIIGAH